MEVELKIFNKEDRLKVAAVLVDNGYTVSQIKRPKPPSGKSMNYFLKVSDNESNADTAKIGGDRA